MSYELIPLPSGFKLMDDRGVSCFLPLNNGFERPMAEAILEVLEHFETAEPPLDYNPPNGEWDEPEAFVHAEDFHIKVP